MKSFRQILALVIIFSGLSARAACDYAQFCPIPRDLSWKTTQALCNITGSSFIARKLAQSIIKNQLKKATGEKFNVDMASYSAKDLASGRFKSLNITGENLNLSGFYLSNFNLKTVCDFNYVDISTKSVKFEENMVLAFETLITAKDFDKSMDSSEYMKTLRNINVTTGGITFFKVQDANVKIVNNRFYFVLKIFSPFINNGQPINYTTSTDLQVVNGRIVFTDLAAVNSSSRLNVSRLLYVINLLNPFTFLYNVLDNENTEVSFRDVKIVDNTVVINGTIFIPKNTVYKD